MEKISSNLCILTNDPFLGYHGSSRQALLKAKELKKRGIGVFLVSLDDNKTNKLFYVQKEKLEDLELHRVSSFLLKNKLGDLIILFFYLFLIRDKFGILQTHTDHFC